MKKLFLILLAAAVPALRAQVNDTVYSSALEAGHVIKAGQGILLSLSGYNAKTSAQFIQVHDSAAVPSDAVAGVAEISRADFTGLTDTDVANKYFTLHSAVGAVYVWFNVGGAGVNPAPDGRGIAVPLTHVANATAIGDAVATALTTDGAFTAVDTTGVVAITDAATGARADITAGTSGAAVSVSTQGVTAIAAAVPVLVITVPASSNFSFTIPAGGLSLYHGISACNSSTSATKTAGSADCFFSGTTM